MPGADRALHRAEERIDGLRSKLAATGKSAVDEMKLIQSPSTNMSDLVAQVRQRVTGLQPLDALAALAGLYDGPAVDQARANAEENLQGRIFGQLFGISMLSADGNTIAKQGSAFEEDETKQNTIWTQMVRDFQVTVGLVARGQIWPAMEAIRLEHSFHATDFALLCTQSPLVPRDRVGMVAKGLYAGYCGDFVQAVHILVPQLENMIRFHMKRIGTHTTTIKPNGIVMENGISVLVGLPQMEVVFGKDLTFELTALFCEQNGPNLRNEVVHGLISEDMCNSVFGIYAWWLVFRLVFIQFWNDERCSPEQPQPTSPDPPAPAGF